MNTTTQGDSPNQRPARLDLLAILSVALILRAFRLSVTDTFDQDSVEYMWMADSIRRHDWNHFLLSGLYWSPFFPCLIAGLQSVLGDQVLSGRVVGVLADLCVVAITYLLSREISRNVGAARLSTLIVATHPTMISLSVFIMSDSLYCAVATASIFCLVKLLNTHRVRYAVWMGALCALSFATRTYGLCFGLAMLALWALLAFWQARQDAGAASAPVALVSGVVTFVILCSAWVVPLSIHNRALTVGTSGTLNLYWRFLAAQGNSLEVVRNGYRNGRVGTPPVGPDEAAEFGHLIFSLPTTDPRFPRGVYRQVLANPRVAISMVGRNALRAAQEVATLGYGIIPLLALLDVLTRGHSPRGRRVRIVLALAAVLQVAGYIPILVLRRYVLPTLPLISVLAMDALTRLPGGALSTRAGSLYARFPKRLIVLVVCAWCMVGPTLYVFRTAQMGLHPRRNLQREIGTWVRNHIGEDRLIVSRHLECVYWARGRFLVLPVGTPSEILDWARRGNADILVITREAETWSTGTRSANSFFIQMAGANTEVCA
jgi:hypothetical protein